MRSGRLVLIVAPSHKIATFALAGGAWWAKDNHSRQNSDSAEEMKVVEGRSQLLLVAVGSPVH